MDRLLNQGNAPLLERMIKFTSAKAEVIAQNVANVDTPNYQQQDLSLPAFQKALQKRLAERDGAPVGSVGFDDIDAQLGNSKSGLFFHDRQNRSMETLMSDLASNGLKHNMYTEMLRKQLDTMASVLKDRVA